MIESAASAASLEGLPSRDQVGCLHSLTKDPNPGTKTQGTKLQASPRTAARHAGGGWRPLPWILVPWVTKSFWIWVFGEAALAADLITA